MTDRRHRYMLRHHALGLCLSCPRTALLLTAKTAGRMCAKDRLGKRAKYCDIHQPHYRQLEAARRRARGERVRRFKA